MREHGSLKLGGGDIQETMVLLSWVGEYMREHGPPKLGGRIYERT